MANKQIKSRAFQFIMYPDSVTGGKSFISELESFNVPFLLSPLHDKDILPNGELKKPHYHCILIFDAPTTLSRADDICKYMGGVREPLDIKFTCNSLSSCARYLIHRDDADKYQYNIKDVFEYGVSYLECCDSKHEEMRTIDEMKVFINKYRVISFAMFSTYCMNYNATWNRLLNTRYSYLIKDYMMSLKWTLEQSNIMFYTNQIVDFETGENLFTFM